MFRCCCGRILLASAYYKRVSSQLAYLQTPLHQLAYTYGELAYIGECDHHHSAAACHSTSSSSYSTEKQGWLKCRCDSLPTTSWRVSSGRNIPFCRSNYMISGSSTYLSLVLQRVLLLYRAEMYDVLEDLGCEKHGVLCSELNEYFKSLIRVKSECISAITTFGDEDKGSFGSFSWIS